MVSNGRQQRKVLVAEDQATNLKLICIHLEKLGFDVHAVTNGQEAIDAALTEPFDLIVLDMQMPQVSGYEAAERLRREGVQTPILALTAHATTGDREKCLHAGCTEYLAKPFCQEDLSSIIDHCLATSSTTSG